MVMVRWSLVSMATLLVAAAGGEALAVPTMDGNASVADGYTSLSTQNTNTQFGDATFPDLIASGGGSEIDQVFGKIEGGRLYMVIAGNLENNFNKLQLFIDSAAGGVSTINGDVFTPGDNNVPFGVDAFCCGGFVPPEGTNIDNVGSMQKMDGMTFDAGFAADYALVFTHGGETVDAASPLGFWAISAHYADLTQGTAGAVVAAGIQLAPQGSPNVLRGPLGPDFDSDFSVDGQDFLTWQQNNGTTVGATKPDGDANGDGAVDAADLAAWNSLFGSDRTLADFAFIPNAGGLSTADLIGPALPGLSQGQLIDRTYALSANGGCTDDSGAGCVAKELEFVLDIDPAEAGAANPSNHRNFNNTINLEMAIDNSNTAGVDGGAEHAGDYTIPTTFDTSAVTTGVEFSIPLTEIGNPAALSDIKITAFVNGSGNDYSSNQYGGTGVGGVGPGGILQGNLGGDGSGGWTGDFAGVDLSTIANDQFVTLTVPALSGIAGVPEPSSLALVCLGTIACGFVGRRRNRQ